MLKLKPGLSFTAVSEFIKTSSKIQAHYQQVLLKGWDAFPAVKQDHLSLGEMLSAAMVHFGIKGLTGSTINTHVVALIWGDDTNINYLALNEMCSLHEQYDNYCKTLRPFPVL